MQFVLEHKETVVELQYLRTRNVTPKVIGGTQFSIMPF